MLGGGVSPANRHDVVLARAIDVGRHVQRAQIDFFAADGGFTGFDQVVFEIGVADVPSVKRARQVGGIAVPVQQIKRRRCFTLQVVAHHVIPNQVVRAQKAEGRGQVLPCHQAALGKLAFPVFDEGFVNEDVQDAGVREVDEGGEESGTGNRLFAPCRQHRHRVGQNRAADAKTQGVDRLGASDVLHHVNRFDSGLLNVVIPRGLGQGLVRISPAEHKGAMALRHGIADQRIFRLQIQDVELVDAGRDQQKGLFKDLGR